ncbi:MAG: insulinase family protein [Bacteroidales bacterium]|nr:insulinase family protein [Bacteroidales bacterium]
MSAKGRIAPLINPVSRFTPAPVKNIFLGNGIPVFLIEGGTEEVMRIEFVLKAGQVMESIPLQASSTNMMLTEGSVKYTSEEIKTLLDNYGIFYHLYSEKDTGGLIFYVLSKHTEKVFELASEILFNPVFPEKEFGVMMNKRLRWFLVNREKVQTLASERFFEALFGKEHPYGKPVTEKDYEMLNTGHLRNFFSDFYTPANMSIIISGKICENLQEILERHLGEKFPGSPPETSAEHYFNGSPEKKIYILKQGAIQSAIRIGSATINKRHPDYPGLKVLNTILGGFFGSRLMKNIREDKGYTYGIQSSAASLNLSGYKVISAEVSNKITQYAIDEIYREIRLLQKEPVRSEEMELVRNYMSGEMVRMFDGPFATAESFKAIWEFGLSVNYYSQFADTIMTITPDELLHLANKYYNTEDLYEVIAG